VLTDLQMPEMDGLTLVREIRERYPFVPTVLMTAHGNEETAITALRSGAASYVAKRNLARRLVETIRDVLTSSVEGREQRRLFECWGSTQFEFVLDNDAGRIPALVNHLRQYIAATAVCDHTEYVRVGVALHEALRNAIHHGNLELSSELRAADSDAYYREAERRRRLSPFVDRRVTIVARESQREGEYTICDEGPGFDTRQVYDPTLPEHLEIPSGRGLFLIRMFMDEVSFNDRGNEITMIHRRRNHDSRETQSASQPDHAAAG
jgi:DNA-binding response OmpR family regulator